MKEQLARLTRPQMAAHFAAYIDAHYPSREKAADQLDMYASNLSAIIHNNKPVPPDIARLLGYKRVKVTTVSYKQTDTNTVIDAEKMHEVFCDWVDEHFNGVGADFARELGVTAQMVNATLNKKWHVTTSQAQALGYKKYSYRTTFYEKIK